MTTTVYSNQDASSPTLNGTSGSLSALLKACLVDGYGAKGAAGWAAPFTATNKLVLRATTGNRMYLRVDDTGVQEARIVGYETMSSVDAGLNAFPTVGQQAGGMYVRKSSTADSTSRPWMLIADDRTFYFFSDTNDAGGDNGTIARYYASSYQYHSGHFMFGEFTSFKPGDNFNTMIGGAYVTGNSQSCSGALSPQNTANLTPLPFFYLPRAFYQSGGAIPVGRFLPQSHYAASTIGNGSIALPDPITGAILYSPVYILEPNNGYGIYRGVMRGFWAPVHFMGACLQLIGGTVAGSGEMSGKTLTHLPVSYGNTTGSAGIETNDWS